MSKNIILCILFFVGLSSAQMINLSGKVTNQAGKPVMNAIVKILHQGLIDTTGTDGSYSLKKISDAVIQKWGQQTEKMVIKNGILQFAVSNLSPIKIDIYDLQGNLLKQIRQQNAPAGIYRFNITENCRAATVLVVKASVGQNAITFRYCPVITGKFTGNVSLQTFQDNKNILAKVTETNDTLSVKASGYKTKTIPIPSYDQTLNITLDTTSGNANLAGIEILTGTHNSKRPLYQSFDDPRKMTFDPEHLNYAAVVYACSSLTIKATAGDAAVTSIVFNNDGDGALTSGTKTKIVKLSAGVGKVTPVTITVTGKDGSTVTTYTIQVKLLNVDEFFWGFYATASGNSYSRWMVAVPNPSLGLNKTINGYVSGSLVWTVTSSGLQGLNKMVLSNYNDGNDDQDTTVIYTAYNDNCGVNAQDGFVVNGTTEGLLTLTGNGMQKGTYLLTTPWGDTIGTVGINWVIKSKKAVEDANAYSTLTYMGVEGRYKFISEKTRYPYPFKTGCEWNTSWDDGL
jgi:hypothetical protein